MGVCLFTSVQQDNYLINGNYKLKAELAGLLLDIHQNQKLVDSVPDFDIVGKVSIPLNIPSKIPVASNIKYIPSVSNKNSDKNVLLLLASLLI